MKYTYNPNLALAGGKDQLRFELGDTQVSGGAETCSLGDEEYVTLIRDFGGELIVLEQEGETCVSLGKVSPSKRRHFPVYRVDKSLWLQVKIKAVEAILFQFSHQVNTSIDSLSYDFGDRAAHWLSIKNILEKELERYTGGSAISSGTWGLGSFGVGIHDNVR